MGAFRCAEQLIQGRYTDGYIKYVNLLLQFDIKPILVYDGRNLCLVRWG
jgi:exonuclease-1